MSLATSTPEARLFDLVASHQRGSADVEVWSAVAAASVGPVLELGAGTARVLAPLLAGGADAYGIELDPMRRAAGLERLRAAGLPDPGGRLLLGDMRRFDHPRAYGLAIAPYNALASVHDADLGRTLSCLARQLGPGAALLAEVQVWPRWPPLGTEWSRATGPWPLHLDGGRVDYRERSALDAGTGVLTVVHDFGFHDGSRTRREFALRIRSLDEWDALLHAAGWARVGPTVDEAGKPAHRASRLLFLRAAPSAGRR